MILGPIQVKSLLLNYDIVYFFMQIPMYLCCQYSLHSTHWYLSEREREVFLGFIILQFLCSLHLEEVPSIVQMKLNTAALLHFIMWFFGIF